MCGICGFSGVGGQAELSRMMDAMRYRGPDGEGQWSDGKDIHLGHLRLAIIDLESGQQPLATIDNKLVIVFNGEIYNHRALRKQLEKLGHQFQTSHSDTEVLLHGYQQWGIDLTRRLNGMWAFALLDRENGQLWLSRDRFGKKPLFFSQNGENLIFSSELSSIVAHPAVSPEIDKRSLRKYFAYGYVPSPSSMLQGVSKLAAGHNLLFDLDTRKSKVHRYWRLSLEPDSSLIAKSDEVHRQLIDKLFSAVEARLDADVPVGIFLSGGVDSAAIAALAISARKGKPIRSFSIGFEDPSFDETAYSDEVAKILGTTHRTEILSSSRCLELMDSIFSRLDEPLGDSSLVPSFLMCSMASEEVTVALSGDGSDELFAGYDPFRALAPAGFYGKIMPKFGHSLLTRMIGVIPVSHRNMSLDFKMKKFLAGLGYDAGIRNPVWLGPLPPGHLSRLFGERIDTEDTYSEAIDAWFYQQGANDIDRTLQFYTEMYLQNDILVKMDRAGMLNSLEVRSPFLDIDFVDLVRRIPSTMKFDGKQTKKVLKESLHPLLPLEILYRSKKGFGIPIGQWFQDGSLSINPDALRGLVDTDFVKRIYSEHRDGVADWRSFLWAHFALERWMQRPEFLRGRYC